MNQNKKPSNTDEIIDSVVLYHKKETNYRLVHCWAIHKKLFRYADDSIANYQYANYEFQLIYSAETTYKCFQIVLEDVYSVFETDPLGRDDTIYNNTFNLFKLGYKIAELWDSCCKLGSIPDPQRFFKTYLKEIKQCAKQLSVYAKKIFLDNEDHFKGLMYRVNNLK